MKKVTLLLSCSVFAMVVAIDVAKAMGNRNLNCLLPKQIQVPKPVVSPRPEQQVGIGQKSTDEPIDSWETLTPVPPTPESESSEPSDPEDSEYEMV